MDDTRISYCHYENKKEERKLIRLDDLKAGILFAMKENLMIQYLLPNYKLPVEYIEVMESIDNSKIASSQSVYADCADVVVLNEWRADFQFKHNGVYVLRIDKTRLFDCYHEIKDVIGKCLRLNIVITDIETFTDNDFENYKQVLATLSGVIENLFINGCNVQLNLLTDRLVLGEMNNCNAGCENITLAPDGKFYVCPAFYLVDDEENYGLGKSKFSIGDLANGLDIKNPHLYKLPYAPICRNCDAYQCKRCVWLNRKMTYEVNTPSHEQCVVAHLERNASRELLLNIRKRGDYFSNIEISEIKYLDPFDVRKEW